MIIAILIAIGAWFLSLTYITGILKGYIEPSRLLWLKHGVPNAFLFALSASAFLYSFHEAGFSYSAFLIILLTFSLSSLPLSLAIKCPGDY